jgi:hypothetical protein
LSGLPQNSKRCACSRDCAPTTDHLGSAAKAGLSLAPWASLQPRVAKSGRGFLRRCWPLCEIRLSRAPDILFSFPARKMLTPKFSAGIPGAPKSNSHEKPYFLASLFARSRATAFSASVMSSWPFFGVHAHLTPGSALPLPDGAPSLRRRIGLRGGWRRRRVSRAALSTVARARTMESGRRQ